MEITFPKYGPYQNDLVYVLARGVICSEALVGVLPPELFSRSSFLLSGSSDLDM